MALQLPFGYLNLNLGKIDIPFDVTSNKRVKRLPGAPTFLRWFSKDYLAVALVLVALLSLTSVYRPRPVGAGEHHVARTMSSPVHQRNLKSTSFESAAPSAVFVPLPISTYTRQPLHADRTLSPRRLPGSYYNRPPPSLLS